MKLKLENSRKRTAIYKEYFCVITTYKQYQVIRFFMVDCRLKKYNPQIEMFARFKMKSSFHKTKRII